MSNNVKVIGGDAKAVSTGAVKELQVATGPAKLFQIVAYNKAASADYSLLLFDAASAPADTSVPELILPLVHATRLNEQFPDGYVCKLGIYLCISSTAATKTLAASADAFLAASYRITS